MYRKISFTMLLIVFLLSACAPQATIQPHYPPVETTPADILATPVSLPPTTIPVADDVWAEYRDPRYGIGIAYPCWWILSPNPPEGMGGSISLRSFDEDYFRAHSIKGYWIDGIVPEGVFGVEIGVFEQVDSAKSNLEIYNGFIDPTLNAIDSLEERQIGQNQATIIRIKNLVNNNDPPVTVYLFRLAPDTLVAFYTNFSGQDDAPDIQGILTSLSLNPNQPVIIPNLTPHEPLIAAACAGK